MAMTQIAEYAHAFMSHAHVDNAICDPYYATLTQRGVSCYYDRQNPQVGRSLSLALQLEIERAQVLIVMVSAAALDSFWVNEEIEMFFTLMAKDRSRILIPVKIAPCELPPRLEARWGIDATAQSFNQVIDELVKALQSPLPDGVTERQQPPTSQDVAAESPASQKTSLPSSPTTQPPPNAAEPVIRPLGIVPPEAQAAKSPSVGSETAAVATTSGDGLLTQKQNEEAFASEPSATASPDTAPAPSPRTSPQPVVEAADTSQSPTTSAEGDVAKKPERPKRWDTGLLKLRRKRMWVGVPAVLLFVVAVGLLSKLVIGPMRTTSAAQTQTANANATASATTADYLTALHGTVVAGETAVAATATASTVSATATAYTPYRAPVPGPGCDKGTGQWTADFPQGVQCLTDKLRLMGEPDTHCGWSCNAIEFLGPYPGYAFPPDFSVSFEMSGISGVDADVEIPTPDYRYIFSFNPDGQSYLSINKLTPPTTLVYGVNGTFNPSVTNTIAILVHGATISFDLNGQQVGTDRVSEPSSPTVIIMTIGGYTSDRVQVDFQNFVYTLLH